MIIDTIWYRLWNRIVNWPNWKYMFFETKTLNQQLYSAVDNHNIKSAEKSIKYGADVNYAGLDYVEKPTPFLLKAITNMSHEEEEEEKRENRAKIPVMIKAILQSDTEMVQFLLEKGASPNCEVIYTKVLRRESALTVSITEYYPNSKITKMLLDAGADVNYVNLDKDKEMSVLAYAVMENDANAVRLLLEKGADANYVSRIKDSEWPVLIFAIPKNNAYIIHSLLKNGADPNCELIINNKAKGYKLRFSTLCLCMLSEVDIKIARMLIKAGADVNYVMQDENNKLPLPVCPLLSYAIENGNAEKVRLLLEHGADPNCEIVFKDGSRSSVLFDSVTQRNNNEITELLINAGAVARASELNGTRLKKTDGLSEKTIEKLLSAGCIIRHRTVDKSAVTKNYSRELFSAIDNNDVKSAEEYIKPGADVNYTASKTEALMEDIEKRRKAEADDYKAEEENTERKRYTASELEALMEDIEKRRKAEADDYKAEEENTERKGYTASESEALMEDIEKRRKAEIK